MSNEPIPDIGDNKAICRKRLQNLSFKEIELKVDRYLLEAAQSCWQYIANEVAYTYRASEKELVIHPNMYEPIKAKATALFINRLRFFTRSIHTQLASITEQEQHHDR